MRDFLCRIATTQLNMTRDEFDEMADSMVIDDVAQILNERAERLELNIPDMQRILQSTFDDQKMATKYHMEWIPPMVSRIDFLLQVFSLICFLRSVPMKKYCCRNMNRFQMFFDVVLFAEPCGNICGRSKFGIQGANIFWSFLEILVSSRTQIYCCNNISPFSCPGNNVFFVCAGL